MFQGFEGFKVAPQSLSTFASKTQLQFSLCHFFTLPLSHFATLPSATSPPDKPASREGSTNA
jgi:hypothetical protein